MQGNLLSISGGPNLKSLRRLKRKSHFLLNKPSVSIRYNHIYFSASSFEKMDINKYKNGKQIDLRARKFLKKDGLDYSHGTCLLYTSPSPRD